MQQPATLPRPNPFSEQGVSKYPPVSPLVGQRAVYQRIQDLLEVMHQEEGSCFRAIYGDWGIGKTRLAHELIASVCGKSRGWIIRNPGATVAERTQLMLPLDKSGVLPVYITFADVLQAHEEGITLSTALSKAVCVALKMLADADGNSYQAKMAEDLQNSICTINPGFSFEQLGYLVQEGVSLVNRAKQAFSYLQQGVILANGQPAIQKLLIIIDEIEVAGEFTSANTAEEKKVQEYPVEQMDIKTLFSAVKEEAGQETLPGISFLLLCSPGVRRVATIEANERRLKEATLEKASGDDLTQLLEALANENYPVAFPGDLARAAFLAADRNFGWFSYIMYPIYYQMQLGKAPAKDYEFLHQVSERIGKTFKSSMIDDLSANVQLKGFLQRVVYHQLPATLEQLGIPDAALQSLLDFTDPYGIKVVGDVLLSNLNGDTLIRSLLGQGYREESAQSTRLVGQGSVSFEPRELLGRFSTFEGAQPETILIYESVGEFASQVRFLTSEDLSEQTITTLHDIFKTHRMASASRYVAPTVTFLLKFNQRWATVGARAWLSDQLWEAIEKRVKDLNQTQVRQRLCWGVAKTLFENMPTKANTILKLKSPYLCIPVSDGDELNVTQSSSMVILYSVEASDTRHDLTEIQKQLPAPVLVIFSSDEKYRSWRNEIRYQSMHELGVMVIARVIEVANREHEFLLRYSFRDEEQGFAADQVRARGRDQQHEYAREWKATIGRWFDVLEEDGYLLKPITDKQAARYNNLRKAYPYLADGKNMAMLANLDNGEAMRKAVMDVILQMSAGTLKIFADKDGTLYFPNVFARLLNILSEEPKRIDELARVLVYRKQVKAGFNAPKSATDVVEHVLGLMEEIGLVEKNSDNRYLAVDATRLGILLKNARNQLGDFGTPPSNYVKAVREFSAPFQQLAYKLKVSEAQLLLLNAELDMASTQLKELDLNSQKKVPAEQPAFLAVAGHVKRVRRSAEKIYRETGLQQHLQIDPATISDHIESVAADQDYAKYSVEYRVELLQDLVTAMEERRSTANNIVTQSRQRLSTVFEKNKDGSSFPTSPLDRILSKAEKDLGEKNVDPSPELVTPQIGANLQTYMMAGELDKAFRRLNQYASWLGMDAPTSFAAQYVRSYNQWQKVIDLAANLTKNLIATVTYFESDPDQSRWLSSETVQRTNDLLERIKNFSAHFAADYPIPTLSDLDQEVQTTEKEANELDMALRTAYQKGINEIRDAIAKTPYTALMGLCARLNQPARVSEQNVWNILKHIDQHSAVVELEKACKKRGGELLQGENWFTQYVSIYKDYKAGVNGEALKTKYGQDILDGLHQKGALRLEIKVNVEL